MLMRFTVVALLLLCAPSLAQETEIRRTSWIIGAQACNVNAPTCTAPTSQCVNNSFIFYLPPDIPDPVEIAEVTIDNEIPWPADLIKGNGGAWFAAVDPGQTFIKCSRWPGNQDCPVIQNWSQQGNQFSALKPLGLMPLGQQLGIYNTKGNYYHKGDGIVIGTPCYTTGGGGFVHPNITFGLLFPKYTKTTTCDTDTKLLLHGKLFPSPVDRSPLVNFISDSSPSWRAVANKPQGSSTSNVTIDTTTPAALGQSSSIRFDGTTNTGAWMNASGDFILGSQDWTLDLWWRPGSVGSQFQQIWGWKSYSGFLLGQQGTQLYFAATGNGTNWNISNGAWGTAALNTWAHVVIQRSGNSIELKQDGVLKQTIPITGSLFDLDKSSVYLGNDWNKVIPATGNVQEVRFSSTARFPVGAYTVPTSPYPCP